MSFLNKEKNLPDESDIQNNMNRKMIDLQIRKKIQYKKAYYATEDSSMLITTDMDRFPYPRWFRGVPEQDKPVIIEREAGYHMILKQKKEKPAVSEYSEYPKHIFTSPCSTVLPIYSKEAFDPKAVNQSCVEKFP